MLFGKTVEEIESLRATFTAGEIRQQPRLWLETCDIIEKNKEAIDAFIKKHITKDTRIVLTGAGTSDYIGDTLATTLKKKLNLRVDAIATTDIVSNPEEFIEKDTPTVLVSYARSGNSPESMGAYDLFQQEVSTIYQLVITCDENGALAVAANASDNALVLLMPKDSNDKGFAMTGSFSCMAVATLLAFDLENLAANTARMKELSAQGDVILEEKYPEVQKMVDYNCKRVVYLGSGFLGEFCQEMALKNMELTSGKIITFREAVMGFRHGPKSIINDETLIIVFVSGDAYTRQYDLDLIKEIHEDSGEHKLVVISYDKDPEMAQFCDQYIEIGGAEVPEIYKIFNYMLFGQMFGLFNSLKCGITPDNPRPDGTVNRVVKGVTIHKFER